MVQCFIPVGLGVLQVLLLLLFFRFDTPPIIKAKGEFELLHRVMANIYDPYVVQEKIDEIGGGHDDEDKPAVGYGAAMCNPMYRKASFVGIMLAMFQQFTGINIFIMYSNLIFKNTGMSSS